MVLEKGCTDTANGYRPLRFFSRARDAFGAILDAEGIAEGDCVLLPAYIGWSPREGSGVFDPVTERGITPVFYRMDARLAIDCADLRHRLESNHRIKAVLLIHYFGFVDPRLDEAILDARRHGLVVIEDAAHALYTDFVGGCCGKGCDYSLYSLHKMLPFTGGGMAAIRTREPAEAFGSRVCAYGDPFAYDFAEIARRRRENYRCLQACLAPLMDRVAPLFEALPDGVVPQTFPARVLAGDRYRLYQQLNDAGFGAVSLYHTLIEPLRTAEPAWEDSRRLAQQIINFPVHQDVCQERYEDMARALKHFLA